MRDYTKFETPLPHPGETLREDFLPQYGLTDGSLAKAMGLKDRTRIKRLCVDDARCGGLELRRHRARAGCWLASGKTFSTAGERSAYHRLPTSRPDPFRLLVESGCRTHGRPAVE
jgi:hypothetical protein